MSMIYCYITNSPEVWLCVPGLAPFQEEPQSKKSKNGTCCKQHTAKFPHRMIDIPYQLHLACCTTHVRIIHTNTSKIQVDVAKQARMNLGGGNHMHMQSIFVKVMLDRHEINTDTLGIHGFTNPSFGWHPFEGIGFGGPGRDVKDAHTKFTLKRCVQSIDRCRDIHLAIETAFVMQNSMPGNQESGSVDRDNI
jgi:hypothetical protein